MPSAASQSQAGLLLALGGALVVSGWADAAEFRPVGDAAAVLYDAPSTKSRKLYVVNRGYPLEVVVVVEGWTKVRDANGDLSWIETRHLGTGRSVMVKIPVARVHERAADDAPVVFQARQNVLLEVLGAADGWLHVRHSDGQTGYVRAGLVWGA